MTKEEITTVLEKHRHWMNRDIDGWKTMRADLSDRNLTGADLTGADLRGAYLRGADLGGANLSDAYLTGANLSDACLTGANLTGANLSNTNLIEADLSDTNLTGADLTGADLRGADLRGANLDECTPKYVCPFACPDEGGFTAWKKARILTDCGETETRVIIKLFIPEDAKRCSATGRKCRANKAIVIDGYILDDTNSKLDRNATIRSLYDNEFTYKIGDVLEVLDFNEDRWVECSTGIHFFITREEAEAYYYY